MKKRNILTLQQRKDINHKYKNGYSCPEIAKQYKCGYSSIYRWIKDDILYKSLKGIRKKRIGKPHKKHKPHKRGQERKTHKKGLERKKHKIGKDRKKHVYKKNKDKYHHLKEKMISLYKELGSAAKVSKALAKDFDAKLSREAVLRRIPQELRGKNRKNKKSTSSPGAMLLKKKVK